MFIKVNIGTAFSGEAVASRNPICGKLTNQFTLSFLVIFCIFLIVRSHEKPGIAFSSLP